jgi:hypothetical protein
MHRIFASHIFALRIFAPSVCAALKRRAFAPRVSAATVGLAGRPERRKYRRG